MQNTAMLNFGQTDRLRRIFSNQFEADGDGYLYRKFRKGAPMRVTARERDDFVAVFERDYPRAYLAMIVGMVLVMLGMVAIAVAIERDLSEPVIYAAVGGLAAIFLIVHYRIWNAPARALARRPAVGQERSRSETRAIMLAETSYFYYFGLLTLFLLLLSSFAVQSEPLSGWDMALMAFYAAASVMAVTVIVQKWRLGRQDRPS